jgi:hypothetical protein
MRTTFPRSVFFGSLAFVLLVCLSTSSQAQLRFGATAGLNRSSLKGDAPDKAKYKTALGYGVGIVGEKERLDSLEVRFDYIDCLAMLKVTTDNERFYFSSGLGIGFLANANSKDMISGVESDVKSLFKSYDFSVLFGVGYVIPAKNTLLTVELRYQQSLSSVADPDAMSSESGIAPRTRFSGFQVFASVLFPRNHK